MAGEITEAYTEAFDAKREIIYGPSVTLKFFEKKTGAAVQLAEVIGGWLPGEERIRGQIETLFKVRVVEQSALTSDVTSRVNRLQWGDNYCVVNSQDPPQGEPRMWTFFTKEIKTGAIK
ncbi:MAG TPA: hypothetical protein VHO25_15845 [Polyangiaceae bacterium]|nr:hypothetical protein [Polyangiaceae bacterium]